MPSEKNCRLPKLCVPKCDFQGGVSEWFDRVPQMMYVCMNEWMNVAPDIQVDGCLCIINKMKEKVH